MGSMMQKGAMAAIDVGALKKIPDSARRMALAMKGDLKSPEITTPVSETSKPSKGRGSARGRGGSTIIDKYGLIAGK